MIRYIKKELFLIKQFFYYKTFNYKSWVKLLLILNILDIGITYVGLSLGLEESNILMKYLIYNHFFIAVIIKLLIVYLGALFFYHTFKIGNKFLKIIFMIYILVINYFYLVIVSGNIIAIYNII